MFILNSKVMKIKLFFELNETIKNDWISLESNNLNLLPFHQYEWIEQFYEINKFKKNLKFLFISVYKNEKAVLIFPFIVKKNLIRCIEYLGFPFNDINAPLYNYRSKLTDQEVSLIKKTILKKLKNYGDIVLFKNQPEYILSEKNKFIFNQFLINKHTCYRIKNNKEFLSNLLNHKFYKTLNYNQKKLNKILFKEVINENEITETFNFFYKNKFQQLEKTNKKNYLKNVLNKDFVKKNFFSKKINKKIYVLKNDENILSMFFVYKTGKNIFYIYPTYNPIFSKYSPGNLALKIFFEKFNNEFEYFDFTVGEETYKEKWSNNKIYLYDNITSFGIVGYIYYLKIKIVFRLKRINFLKKIFLLFRGNF